MYPSVSLALLISLISVQTVTAVVDSEGRKLYCNCFPMKWTGEMRDMTTNQLIRTVQIDYENERSFVRWENENPDEYIDMEEEFKYRVDPDGQCRRTPYRFKGVNRRCHLTDSDAVGTREGENSKYTLEFGGNRYVAIYSGQNCHNFTLDVMLGGAQAMTCRIIVRAGLDDQNDFSNFLENCNYKMDN